MTDPERRIDEAIAAYYQAREQGRSLPPAEWLAAYPGLEGALRSFLDAEGLLRRGPRDGQPADSPAEARVLGDYLLGDVLGRGGMGVVYVAYQPALARRVAVKVVRDGEFASADEVHRFQAEARTLARLDHGHIVRVHEAGEWGGRHYLVMELIDGACLADLVRDQPLPPRRAAEVARQVAEGVAYAHANQVVHRDIKPSNVLLDRQERAKLTDFGLAKRLDAATGLTLSGAVMGTPSYMSPEQAMGRTGDVGPASDIYSLGALLYEILTGRPPFKAATVLETLQQVCGTEPAPPRLLNPHVPLPLQAICLKCLEKDASRRYASAAELAADLSRFLAGDAVHARPAGALTQAVTWFRRNYLAAVLVALIGAVAGLAEAAPSWLLEQELLGRSLEQIRAADPASELRSPWLAVGPGTADRFSAWPWVGAIVAGVVVVCLIRPGGRAGDLGVGAAAGLVALVISFAVAGGAQIYADPALAGVRGNLDRLAAPPAAGAGQGRGDHERTLLAATVRHDLIGGLSAAVRSSLLLGTGCLLVTVLTSLYAGRIHRELEPGSMNLLLLCLALVVADTVLLPLFPGWKAYWPLRLLTCLAGLPLMLLVLEVMGNTGRLGCAVFPLGMILMTLDWALPTWLLAVLGALMLVFLVLGALLDGPARAAGGQGEHEAVSWSIDLRFLKVRWRQVVYIPFYPLFMFLWDRQGVYFQVNLLISLFEFHRGEPLIVPGTRRVVP